MQIFFDQPKPQGARRPAGRSLAQAAPGSMPGRPSRSQENTMDAVVRHDPSLLVAALEEIEYRRCALETLREEDLLWRCLV
jgi:hypothetical protein